MDINKEEFKEIFRSVLREELAPVIKHLDNINSRLENIENKLGNIENKLDNIENRFNNVETKIDEIETKDKSRYAKLEGEIKEVKTATMQNCYEITLLKAEK